MNRRGFIGSILAACAAPAIVRADSLMRIIAPETTVATVQWGHQVVDEYIVTKISEASGNKILTLDMIAREAIRIAHERVPFIGSVSTEHNFLNLGDRLTMPREKVGDTIRIRMPSTYMTRLA